MTAAAAAFLSVMMPVMIVVVMAAAAVLVMMVLVIMAAAVLVMVMLMVMTAAFFIMVMLVVMMVFMIMMMFMLLQHLLHKLLLQIHCTFNGFQNIHAVQLLQRSGNNSRLAVMFPDQGDRLLNFSLGGYIGPAQDNRSCMLNLVNEEFTEVLDVKPALGGVNYRNCAV